ncbi:hypothetical protein, conserved [Trypanosoma brucei gambiense DAL972]|uniref:Protein OS9-like domain-containing protein n=1 Tax=Trypanosoma brucei gambiense (strain MHOM/CI/86/DAL972) TaxID=679716 RepID=C9ZYI3_TRYB9|nr:hypothetical protein, conserved [Trypanosoma brucei gambiense DAL972]CBH14482.1 hypothetical protein, conserved [Trypanosoma brucei gambiense DAL972]|eukprot:XP_011776748.1 hypothetical protein, conserved [Trypanosoma brucei gambiense DAL972]
MAEAVLAGRAALTLASLYLLLKIVSAKECEWAQRLREYEVEVFSRTNPSGSESEVQSGCISWKTGYWTYEVCPGRWIRQFHKDGNVIVDENFLGVQHRWHLADEIGSKRLRYRDGIHTIPERLNASGAPINNTEATYTCSKDVSVSNVQVDVLYSHGTMCGRGYRRSSQLHLVCNEDVKKADVKLKELELCKYDITVVASTVCDAIYGRSRAYRELSDADMIFAL